MARHTTIYGLGLSIQTLRKFQKIVAKALGLETDNVIVYQAQLIALGDERFTPEDRPSMDIFVESGIQKRELPSAILTASVDAKNAEFRIEVRILTGEVKNHFSIGGKS